MAEEPVASVAKHVQQMSIDGDDPPPRYIIKDGIYGLANTSAAEVSIPIIDLSLLSVRESRELERLKSTLSSWGCFQGVGHGISSSFLEKTRETVKQFFSLPVEEKEKYSRAADDVEGYGNDPIFSEEQVLDWSYRLILKLLPKDSRKLQLWPTNPHEFGELLDEHSEKMASIINLLLKAMAASLNLEEDCFLKLYGDQELMTARFNYYPVCSKSEHVLGAKAHMDGSGLTVLLQDNEVEGLQIFKDDQWFKVPVIPDALVINVGSQMQIMSNGIFKSPLHRVSAPSKKDRTSLAVFHLPNPEVEIEPAKGLVDDKRPQMYRKVKNFSAINFECFQSGKIALDTVKI